MADSSVTVDLKARCFASFTIAGVPVEIFTETINGQAVQLQVKSPKKIGALRVYQELPGFDDSKPRKLDVAGGDDPLQRKRA